MDGIDLLSSMHFIVDGRGNYYRINGSDQLVVADGREDAGLFSFVEANRRIGGGKKSHFYSAIPVEEESTCQAKEATGYAEKVKTEKVPENTADVKTVELTDLKELDLTEYLNQFCKIVSGIPKYQEELKQALSDIDLQICDILHYIELYDTDKAKSMYLIELLKECREQRRDVKDAMFNIDCFKEALGTMFNVAKAKDSIKQMKKLNTRVYRPRKLEELFADCPEKTIRENKLMQVFSENTCMDVLRESNGNMECASENYTVNAGNHGTEWEEIQEVMQEGTDMEYTRKQTVYDGKENDWQQFIVKQTEFYANIEQYVMNLQADINDLDQEMADVLTEIDNANYNVAQGYKVLKHLKELRNQKNEKQKELACLYLLTDRFDCKAMADAMRDCEVGIGEIMGA